MRDLDRFSLGALTPSPLWEVPPPSSAKRFLTLFGRLFHPLSPPSVSREGHLTGLSILPVANRRDLGAPISSDSSLSPYLANRCPLSLVVWRRFQRSSIPLNPADRQASCTSKVPAPHFLSSGSQSNNLYFPPSSKVSDYQSDETPFKSGNG